MYIVYVSLIWVGSKQMWIEEIEKPYAWSSSEILVRLSGAHCYNVFTVAGAVIEHLKPL